MNKTDFKQLRQWVIKQKHYSPQEKLALLWPELCRYLWLFEEDVEYFKGKDLYEGCGMTKVHFNNWLRPRLEEAGWIKRLNRTDYRFFNVTKVDLF